MEFTWKPHLPDFGVTLTLGQSLYTYTVKNAVELLDVTSRNNSLMMKNYNSHVEILFLYTHVLFFNSVIE
jgi:hypothetical protein